MKALFFFITGLFMVVVWSNAQNSSPYWSLAGNSTATSSSKLGTTNAINLRLFTNNSERMRVSTLGLVGIGTTSPNSKLHVNSSSGQQAIRAQVNGATKFLVHNKGGVAIGSGDVPPPNGLYVAGKVGIGTNAPAYKLHVESTIHAIYAHTNTGNPDVGYSAIKAEGSGLSGGIYGGSQDGIGVYGHSDYNDGVFGHSTYGHGIVGSSTNSFAGYFLGSVYCSGTYQGSDRTLKQNITDLNSAMVILAKLQPKTYKYRQDGSYKLMNLPAGIHYGLIAQEVEQVLPNLITDAEFNTAKMVHRAETVALPGIRRSQEEVISFKALNYTELIPIMVKGMQEQQMQMEQQETRLQHLMRENDEKDKEISELQNQITELKSLIVKGGNIPNGPVASLGHIKQNSPNPFNNNTLISYYIPENAGTAHIKITDAKGRLVKMFNTAKGEGKINIKRGELAAGTYNYTLYISNKPVDTKQMVLIK